jgi:hypothetical protein
MLMRRWNTVCDGNAREDDDDDDDTAALRVVHGSIFNTVILLCYSCLYRNCF